MAISRKALVKATTTTTGTGTYTVGSAASGYRSFSVVTDGDTCHVMVKDASGNFERGLYTKGGGGSPTLARTTIYESSNAGAAVNWGVGTRDIYIIDEAELALLSANNLSDLAATGTARENLGIDPPGCTGGTNGKFVRITSANTYTDASKADTAAQLASLRFKLGGFYRGHGEYVSGLSGLTAGTRYFLDASASTPNYTSTAPTPSGSVRLVGVLTAISTTEAIVDIGPVIGG